MKFETEREVAQRRNQNDEVANKNIAVNVIQSGQSLLGKTDVGNNSEVSSTSLSAM